MVSSRLASILGNSLKQFQQLSFSKYRLSCMVGSVLISFSSYEGRQFTFQFSYSPAPSRKFGFFSVFSAVVAGPLLSPSPSSENLTFFFMSKSKQILFLVWYQLNLHPLLLLGLLSSMLSELPGKRHGIQPHCTLHQEGCCSRLLLQLLISFLTICSPMSQHPLCSHLSFIFSLLNLLGGGNSSKGY